MLFGLLDQRIPSMAHLILPSTTGVSTMGPRQSTAEYQLRWVMRGRDNRDKV